MADDMRNGHTSSVVRRIVLGAMVVIGAFMFVLPLATNLPGKSAASGDHDDVLPATDDQRGACPRGG